MTRKHRDRTRSFSTQFPKKDLFFPLKTISHFFILGVHIHCIEVLLGLGKNTKFTRLLLFFITFPPPPLVFFHHGKNQWPTTHLHYNQSRDEMVPFLPSMAPESGLHYCIFGKARSPSHRKEEEEEIERGGGNVFFPFLSPHPKSPLPQLDNDACGSPP